MAYRHIRNGINNVEVAAPQLLHHTVPEDVNVDRPPHSACKHQSARSQYACLVLPIHAWYYPYMLGTPPSINQPDPDTMGTMSTRVPSRACHTTRVGCYLELEKEREKREEWSNIMSKPLDLAVGSVSRARWVAARLAYSTDISSSSDGSLPLTSMCGIDCSVSILRRWWCCRGRGVREGFGGSGVGPATEGQRWRRRRRREGGGETRDEERERARKRAIKKT